MNSVQLVMSDNPVLLLIWMFALNIQIINVVSSFRIGIIWMLVSIATLVIWYILYIFVPRLHLIWDPIIKTCDLFTVSREKNDIVCSFIGLLRFCLISQDTGGVPSATSKLSPLPHEPYDRGETFNIPLNSSKVE